MKITREQAIKINKVLSNFNGTYNKLFSMYIVLNLKKLVPTMEEVQEIVNSGSPSPEYLELQKKELDIVNKYIEKDENNNPVMISKDQFKIKEEFHTVYIEEKKELIENNQNIINEYRELNDSIEKLIKEEIEVDIIKIPFGSVPEEIEVENLEILSAIISDFGKV